MIKNIHFGLKSLISFLRIISPRFQNYWGFLFENIDPDNPDTFPTFYEPTGMTEDFVFIQENPGFNCPMAGKSQWTDFNG